MCVCSMREKDKLWLYPHYELLYHLVIEKKGEKIKMKNKQIKRNESLLLSLAFVF